MTRPFIAFFLLAVTGITFAAEKPPKVPGPAEAVRYERYSAVWGKDSGNREVPKMQGDEVLAALDRGRAVEPWYKFLPPGIICALPVPTPNDITAEGKDGRKYAMRFTDDGGFVELPQGWYVVNEPARAKIAKVAAWLKEDKRREIVAQPRPCTYVVSSIDDGGTLYGIARLFYGDARKWKQIYEANRATIKNPDVIVQGMKLTIPKLD